MYNYDSNWMSNLQISNYNMDLQLLVHLQLAHWAPKALLWNIFFIYAVLPGEL